MVETAEADIVCSAVAGDNPLAAGYDVVLEFEDAFADVAAACLAQRNDFVVHLIGFAGAVASCEPLGCQSLDFIGAFLAGGGGFHQGGDAFADFFGGYLHAQTEFGEVLEEGVAPCRAVAFGVGGVGGGGHGTGVDGGAAGGIGYHLMVAEELGHEFHVGSLAAARAGAGEFEQRGCELAVLGVELHIYQVLLAGYVVHAEIPVFLYFQL